MDLKTPREVDQALKDHHRALDRLDRDLEHLTHQAQCAFGDHRQGGSRFHKAGRWTTTGPQVWERAEIAAAAGETYARGFNPSELLAERAPLLAQRQALAAVIDELEKLYTGWSRFFLVTSSQGHIHSSRDCRTCFITTTFGWRPELSGKSEAEAVAELGPALCSVCFPSAPVEHQRVKVTKAQALRLAA